MSSDEQHQPNVKPQYSDQEQNQIQKAHQSSVLSQGRRLSKQIQEQNEHDTNQHIHEGNQEPTQVAEHGEHNTVDQHEEKNQNQQHNILHNQETEVLNQKVEENNQQNVEVHNDIQNQILIHQKEQANQHYQHQQQQHLHQNENQPLKNQEDLDENKVQHQQASNQNLITQNLKEQPLKQQNLVDQKIQQQKHHQNQGHHENNVHNDDANQHHHHQQPQPIKQHQNIQSNEQNSKKQAQPHTNQQQNGQATDLKIQDHLLIPSPSKYAHYTFNKEQNTQPESTNKEQPVNNQIKQQQVHDSSQNQIKTNQKLLKPVTSEQATDEHKKTEQQTAQDLGRQTKPLYDEFPNEKQGESIISRRVLAASVKQKPTKQQQMGKSSKACECTIM